MIVGIIKFKENGTHKENSSKILSSENLNVMYGTGDLLSLLIKFNAGFMLFKTTFSPKKLQEKQIIEWWLWSADSEPEIKL